MRKHVCDFLRIESGYDSCTRDHQRPANQVWFLTHHTDRLFARRRIGLHLLAPVQLVARIEKLAILPVADQMLKLIDAERLFGEIAKTKFESAALDEPSSFAACRSSWFVKEEQRFAFPGPRSRFALPRCHSNPLQLPHLISRHFRIHFDRPTVDSASHRLDAANPLRSKPGGGIQAANSVMAIQNKGLHAR
jgi:hypothetical protein